MKLRKVSLILVITIAMLMIASIFSASYAKSSSPLRLRIIPLRSSGHAYRAGPIGPSRTYSQMWKIAEVTDQNVVIADNNKTIYCLRGGPGFGSGSTESMGVGIVTRDYEKSLNMKTPNEIMKTGNEGYKKSIEKLFTAVTVEEDKNENGKYLPYKSLIWLLDNIYVAPIKSTDDLNSTEYQEFKDMLLANAGIAKNTKVTDNDIDVVQQLAIWYFTGGDNYQIEKNDSGEYVFNIHRTKTTDLAKSSWENDNSYTEVDSLEDCKKLFNYLVDTAKSMGKDGNIDDISDNKATKPYELDKTLTIEHKTSGNNYVIGPFKINKISDTVGTLTAKFYNGDSEIAEENITMQDANGKTIATIEDTVGKEFFISIPTSIDIENIKLEIGGSYFNTELTYWSVLNAPDADQPVVEVERTRETYNEDITYTPAPKQFDLALRKFITSINGKAPTVSREPKVDLTTLKNGTFNRNGKKEYTATYTHPKTALEVKTGDKVIYTIRVYNEGELDAYVKEVTDYLPEGLKLAENSTINTNNGWTNPSSDGKTIVTSKLGKTLLKAFDGTNLKYLDVQIECEVTAKGTSTQSLKNIAEITAHSDDQKDTTVADRDSTPNDVNRNTYGTTSQEDDDDYEQLIVPGKIFDLALRKFITSINGKAPAESREPEVDLTTLKNGTFNRNGKKEYTATYTHPKNALEVKTGDKVIYTIRVYNEGEADAYVKEVTDYLPDGLKLAENSTINTEKGWTNPSKDGKTIVTSKLGKTLLKAFNGTTLEYLDVQIECEVTARGTSTKSLKNIAEITAHSDSENDTTVTDRDSTPNDVNRNTYGTISQEDDDDYEQLIIVEKKFDLALRKFITAVGKKELVDENGKYIREPKVDVTPLLNNETTAIYEHSKTAVSVDVGDEVTYTLRVYNEGETDGYADEITDYLPEWLEFVNDEFNAQYGWKVSEDGRKVSTTITSKNTDYSASRDTIYANRTQEQDKVLLKAFDKTKKELDYIDVKIKCKVKDTGIAKKITNIAEITKASDDSGNTATDIDSKTNNITLPKDDVLPNYKDDEIESGEKYIPGQEDDDDFEKVIVQKFDLSLRKFITAVNSTEITERVPVFSMDSEKKFTYTHPKTPVEVVNGDVIVYTLRIYNEGNQAGYADEVKDNLPEGLVYLPENEINKEYRWKLYKEDGTETTEVSEAKTVRTDYLSRDQEIQTKRNNLLKAFNTETMTQPDYRDVKIAFKVTEPNTSDRIIINTAEISKDSDDKGNSVEDIDSTPDNDKEDEDDIDIEKVKVKYFDLALEKIVSEYSIKQNGKTTVTKTGHKFGVQPEPPVKVELVNSMVKSAVIKFKYQIKVTNEGEIAGYAEEVKDYIPSGLKFVKEDNPKWTMLEDGNTVTTDQLKDKLLQPGESAVVEITLQWINGQNNFGLKQNWAEISKDKNDSDSPDIDSVPNNKKEGEDDIDDASVLLSVKTGSAENYIVITGSILAIVSAGIVLIKKFVI